MKSSELTLEARPARIQFLLGRVLASGFVDDPRFPTTNTRFTIGGPDIIYAPRFADWKPFLDRVEEHLKLEPPQRVTWNVFTEADEWFPLDYAMVWGDGFDGKPFGIRADLRPVNDPDLKPVFLPHGDEQSYFPARIRILPEKAFSPSPPDWLDIRFFSETGVGFRPASSSQIIAKGFNKRGHHFEGTTYQFWLPAGTYSLTSPKFPIERGLEKAPHFIPSGPLIVEDPQNNSRFDLFLEPDESFIKCQPVDNDGFAVDLRGFLAVQGAQDWRGYIAMSGTWPRERFIRPGTYTILAWDENTSSTVPILENLIWPAPVDGDGIWRIPIPDLSEPASVERFH